MKGLDALALGSPQFPVALVARIVPHDWAIGCFWDTFGDCRHNLQALYAAGFRTFRIQAWWDDKHKIVPLVTLGRIAKAIEKFKQNHPEATIYLSFSCEYQESNPAEIRKRADLIKRLAPSCIPVSSPMKSSPAAGTIVERHGDVSTATGQIVSLDGTDMRDVSMDMWSAKNKQALIAFAWITECNLSLYNGPKLPRDKRHNPPTKAQLQLIVDVMNSYF